MQDILGYPRLAGAQGQPSMRPGLGFKGFTMLKSVLGLRVGSDGKIISHETHQSLALLPPLP